MRGEHHGNRFSLPFGNYFLVLTFIISALLLSFAVYPFMIGSVSAAAGDPIDTISNPHGTTIDLFDYWAYSTNTGADGRFQSITRIPVANPISNTQWTGINDGHALKFMQNHWDVSGNSAYWYMRFPGDEGLPVTGIVNPVLDSDGYPTLSSRVTSSQESLKYLFDHENIRRNYNGQDYDFKKAYPGVNELFYVDQDGYYVFDSDVEDALYDPDSGNFVVTEGSAEFLPFGPNQIPDPNNPTETIYNPNAYFLGMHMKIEDFSIPTDGKVMNPSGDLKDMTFEF